MYFVYILYSKTYDRYYIGQCEELSARLTRHNAGAVISTKAYRPWEIVYSETYPTRAAATFREIEIKGKKSRKYIEYLIQNDKSGTPKRFGTGWLTRPDNNRDSQ